MNFDLKGGLTVDFTDWYRQLIQEGSADINYTL